MKIHRDEIPAKSTTDNNEVILDLLIFLVSPLALWIKYQGAKSASDFNKWLKIKNSFSTSYKGFGIMLSINFIFLILSIIFITNHIWQLSLFAYVGFILSQAPYLRILLLNRMNRQVDLDQLGMIDPAESHLIKSARNNFGIKQAEIQYRKAFNKLQRVENRIGTRVIPSTIKIPFFGNPNVSEFELASVIDEEFARFPLNSESPDHHLVIGQSGSGKTTLIKRMISVAINSGWRVILIDLKGDPDDAKDFLNLVTDQSRVRHFPGNAFHFWNGSKSEIAERIISFFPSDSEPYYLSRNSTAIQAVITRSDLPAPQSVQELVNRIRNGVNFACNPDDIRFFSTKERGVPISNLIANDISMNLDSIRNIEEQTPFRFGWGDKWDLSVFTLDGFKPSSLKIADALLNDFASWMFSEERTMNKSPILLVIDEASAFSRVPQIPILTALIQRARSAKVSLVYASQNISAFGSDTANILHSGAIRWLGVSTEVEEIINASGTKNVVESGFQFDSEHYTGVISHRIQKEFKIDPDKVKQLPTFHWFVSARGKVSNVFVPPLNF